MSKSTPFHVIYFSGFIDYAGIAIVYPIFALLFFDPALHFFASDTSVAIRGIWLGVMVGLYPAVQFFSAPILGALSDRYGRKHILTASLWISAMGYAFAVLSLVTHRLEFLSLYRILAGVGAGNGSILGAMVADRSPPEERSRYFGRLSMSYGAGFTLAPFLGGMLTSHFGYVAPFLVPFFCVLLNIVLVVKLVEETVAPKVHLHNIWNSCLHGLLLIRKAHRLRYLRPILSSLFIYTLGWAFFTEFVPVFLSSHYAFTPQETGLYYGYSGLFYAISAGFLVPKIIGWWKAESVLPWAQGFAGLFVIGLLFIAHSPWLWLYMPFVNFWMAFVYPTTVTLISTRSDAAVQGEVIGIYQAVNALAMAVCPLCTGFLASIHPESVVGLGGGVMALGGLFLWVMQRLGRQSVVA